MKRGLYFEYERVSDVICSINKYLTLRFVVDLGFKDKNGEKHSFIEQYEYETKKYGNADKLITAKRKFVSYIAIEYPNNDENNEFGKTKLLPIFDYNMIDLKQKMNEFGNVLSRCFIRDNSSGKSEIIVSSSKSKTIRVDLSDNDFIEFTPEVIYTGKNRDKATDAVIININNEFRTITTVKKGWKAFLYHIQIADLYGWGSTAVTAIMTNAINPENIIQIQPSQYGSGKYQEISDEDESEASVSNNCKPLNKRERIKSFFDD